MRPGEMGEHGGCLAETHVQREAAAQIDGIEVLEPAQRLRLVRPQLADEAVRLDDGLARLERRLLQQVRGPPGALHGGAFAQRGALEADGVTEDLRAGELRRRRAFGQRGSGFLEVDAVELDPSSVRLHERTRLRGQSRHVVGRQLDVVEHRRPTARCSAGAPPRPCRPWAR